MSRLALFVVFALSLPASAAVVKSAGSGNWSDARTWDGGKVPATGDTVVVREGHAVVYDVKAEAVLRAVFIAGTLAFEPNKDTELNAGLVKVQRHERTDEDGFDIPSHDADARPKATTGQPGFTAGCLCCDGKPALLVGTPERPIAKSAKIRLHFIDGMDRENCPAIVSAGGRMDFHGRPMSRTWVKLGKDSSGDTLTLAEAVTGWKPGDRLVVTTSGARYGGKGSEERVIKGIDGATVTLTEPLSATHSGEGEFRAEVANLSRNVVVESADPAGVRGHTMYHHGSAGGISFAEFRHLGKKGVLGRYPVHFHLCRDTTRGSSVVGASIWDSHNRFVTVHGTEYLVVRDCVGFRSLGHGFFLEDGTEVYNVFDRNLAVQATEAEPLPKQQLPFDKNEGAGFWWANSHNTFTRNVAAECDGYGFRYEATPLAGPYVKGQKPKPPAFDLRLNVRTPDGTRAGRDVRTLPFVRFADNEAHHIGTYGLNLGQDAEMVGPDRDHPFVVGNMKVWLCGRGYTVHVPHVKIDGLRIHFCGYEVYRARYNGQDYQNVKFTGISGKWTVTGLDDYVSVGKLNRNRLPGFPAGTGAGGTALADPEVEAVKLTPVDDLPPITVITSVRAEVKGLLVRGTVSDNTDGSTVTVNGTAATVAADGQWEVQLPDVKPGAFKLTAKATDAAKNAEKTPHELTVVVR
jgi:hypothetical protein